MCSLIAQDFANVGVNVEIEQMDFATLMSRMLDGIMIRTFEQKEVEMLAEYGSIPIING